MSTIDPIDKELLSGTVTTKDLTDISDKEFLELQKVAQRTVDIFEALCLKIVTPERAARIKELRVVEGYSWRAVARQCHEEFEGHLEAEWYPESNQLMGVALCNRACELLSEDPSGEDW
jgi:hypothetical protein